MKMKYDQAKYDVEAGAYEVQFLSVEEKEFPPQPGTKFGGGGGLKYLWKFKVVSGPLKDKVIEQITGSDLVPKSKLLAVVTMLTGRQLQQGEEVDPSKWVGRFFNLTWSINPDSDRGRCHISSLVPIQDHTATTALPATDGPPPMPTAAKQDDKLYWFQPPGEPRAVKWKFSAIRDYVSERKLNPADVMVCPESGREWVTLKAEDEVPF